MIAVFAQHHLYYRQILLTRIQNQDARAYDLEDGVRESRDYATPFLRYVSKKLAIVQGSLVLGRVQSNPCRMRSFRRTSQVFVYDSIRLHGQRSR